MKIITTPQDEFPDSPTWPHVLAFARRMEAKLEANRHKGNREAWLNDDVAALIVRLDEERIEMEREAGRVALGPSGVLPIHAETLANECADVANFAMMIADWHLERAKG